MISVRARFQAREESAGERAYHYRAERSPTLAKRGGTAQSLVPPLREEVGRRKALSQHCEKRWDGAKPCPSIARRGGTAQSLVPPYKNLPYWINEAKRGGTARTFHVKRPYIFECRVFECPPAMRICGRPFRDPYRCGNLYSLPALPLAAKAIRHDSHIELSSSSCGAGTCAASRYEFRRASASTACQERATSHPCKAGRHPHAKRDHAADRLGTRQADV